MEADDSEEYMYVVYMDVSFIWWSNKVVNPFISLVPYHIYELIACMRDNFWCKLKCQCLG